MEAEFVLVVVDGEFVGLIVVRNPCNVVLDGVFVLLIAIFDPCDVDIVGEFVLVIAECILGNVLGWMWPKIL